MTQLLARAFTEAAQLPVVEQEALATRILADLEQRASAAKEVVAIPPRPRREPRQQLEAVRAATQNSFPTGDIEQMLNDRLHRL